LLIPYFIQPSFKSIDAGSIFDPLVQLISSINHSRPIGKKSVPYAPKFNYSFLKCPVIPLVSAIVKKTHTTLSAGIFGVGTPPIRLNWNYISLPETWRRGVVDYMVSGVRRMNEVNARRARLVPGWVTVFGPVYHLGM